MIIHLGFERTGTTFLQKNVFPFCNERVLSNEFLSGHPVSPLRFGIELRTIILKGSREHFGNVKIILGIRDKDKWVRSLYNTYISGSGFYSFDKWYADIFDERYLDYLSYISEIKSLFDDVFIFDLDEFNIKELCKFINVDVSKIRNEKVNRSLNKPLLKILGTINLFTEGIKYYYRRVE